MANAGAARRGQHVEDDDLQGRRPPKTDGEHGDDKEHKIERQTWVSEYEIYELSDDGETVVSHAEKRGPVKNQKTLECSCGQRFRKIEQRVNT